MEEVRSGHIQDNKVDSPFLCPMVTEDQTLCWEVAAYRNDHPYMLLGDLGELFLVAGTLLGVEGAVMIVVVPYKPADFESCNDCRTDFDDAEE